MSRLHGSLQIIPMAVVVGGRRYRTETAELLAHDAYWDGSNRDRSGRNVFLFRSPRGSYFVQYQTMLVAERNRIEAISEAEARALYERLPEHEVEYEVAFPGTVVEDA